jgi:aminoglycoside phosphotransferase (APT) family kinase protein
VIDWGVAGIGDPTVDLIVAWNLLPASISLIQLPYYQHMNPALAANSRHVIAEILADAVS